MKAFKSLCLLVALLVVAGSSAPLQAGEQNVRVMNTLSGNEAETDALASQSIQEARARAVFQEAQDLLPGQLAEPRAEALFAFLSSRAQEYVLSYSRGKSKKRGALLTTDWRVAVNDAELKQTLRDWGVYFTFGGAWPYSLDLQVANFESHRETLQRLELVSGLSIGNQVYPKLQLRSQGGQEEAWQGRLELNDKSWSASGAGLEEVWFELWTHYFRLPSVQSRAIESTILVGEGWSSITGVRGFDRVLRENSALINEVDLLHTDFRIDSLAAVWKLGTPDLQGLLRFLKDYCGPRGLTYRLQDSRGG